MAQLISNLASAKPLSPKQNKLRRLLRRGAPSLILLSLLIVGFLFTWTDRHAAQQGGTLPNQIGRLTSSGNSLKRTSVEYDVLGRVTSTTHVFEGSNSKCLGRPCTFTTAYGYPQPQPSPNGFGTVPISETEPDNEKIEYAYDKSGAQQSIKTTPSGSSQQTIISSIRRNARGQSTEVTYGNGAVTTYTYNDTTNLRLSQIQTVISGTTRQDYLYSFDNNGNVTGVSDQLDASLSATYGYDSLDQLVSMFIPSSGTTLNYEYDSLGNLTNKEGVAQTYHTGGLGRGPHALASANGVNYTYDNNGNLISTSNGTNITWNPENMATRVVQSGVQMNQKSFIGEGLWKKVEPGLTTYYLPGLRLENNQYRKFYASFAERSPDGTFNFYHNDHLGSASLVTSQDGTPLRRQAYMPYGADRFLSNPGNFTARYQFNFKEKESDFYDYGARLYNPATGRWLSADSFLIDGLNRYSYVRNQPLRYRDETGNWSTDVHEKIIAEAFNALGAGAIASIQKGSWAVDNPFGRLAGQREAQAYMHAMRRPPQRLSSGGRQTVAEATAEAQIKTVNFIAQEISAARTAQKSWRGRGIAPYALVRFGEALHPLMDSTSPAHVEYQEFKGYDFFSVVGAAKTLWGMHTHSIKEDMEAFTPVHLAQNVAIARLLFRLTFPEHARLVPAPQPGVIPPATFGLIMRGFLTPTRIDRTPTDPSLLQPIAPKKIVP